MAWRPAQGWHLHERQERRHAATISRRAHMAGALAVLGVQSSGGRVEPWAGWALGMRSTFLGRRAMPRVQAVSQEPSALPPQRTSHGWHWQCMFRHDRQRIAMMSSSDPSSSAEAARRGGRHAWEPHATPQPPALPGIHLRCPQRRAPNVYCAGLSSSYQRAPSAMVATSQPLSTSSAQEARSHGPCEASALPPIRLPPACACVPAPRPLPERKPKRHALIFVRSMNTRALWDRKLRAAAQMVSICRPRGHQPRGPHSPATEQYEISQALVVSVPRSFTNAP